jgi:hypothetical protein
MSLKKAKTIAKAFINELPEGEDWYKKRLEICSVCPYNTKNIPKDQLKISEKMKIASGVCDDNHFCTACGCCIVRKAAVKSEECGLTKLYMDPKWSALLAQSKLNQTITMENMTPEEGSIVVEDTQFTYDFGIRKEERLQLVFRLTRLKAPLNIKAIRPGCTCTSVDETKEIDENTIEVTVSLSTKGFRRGLNGRKLYVEHFLTKQKVDEVTINLKVNKPNGK